MRYLLLAFLLSCSLFIYASDVLVVEQTTGNTSYTISHVKELTFDGNGVKVSFTDNTSVYYGKDTLSALKFSVETSGLDNQIGSDSMRISVNDNVLFIENYKGNINVYSLDGSIVLQGMGNKLDISNLPSGAYIVQAGSLISKIVKQ